MGDYKFAFAIKALMFLMTLLNTIIINRYLGPVLKGEYAYYLNVINIAVIILNLGVYQAYPNFKKNKIENVKNAFLNLTIVLFIINIFLVSLFSLLTKSQNVLIIYLLIPIMVFSRQVSFISLVENLKIKNILTITTLFLYSAGLLIVYSIFKPSVYITFALLYLQEIIFAILAIKTLDYKFSVKNFSFPFMLKVVRFGILPMFTVLLSTLNYKVDIFIIKDLLDYRNIGIYTVGVNFADIIGIIPNVIQEVLFSRSTKENLMNETIKALRITLYINIITLLSFIIFGNSIITLLYGNDFSYSAIIAIVAIAGMIPMTFFKLISSILIIDGKKIFTFTILFISVVLNIILNYFLIPQIGIIGAAITSVISYAFSGISILIYFCKENSVPISKIVLITKNDFTNLKMILKRK
ncbi:polysaccharide biosynthesis C-terminal domain-containing protein [Fusibacter paucivorans]|uniref:Polysaccharide biosynthesis C-terminal domain-containing protein n=1 Tax=Fusibacter paucivorans TaxID=76009 RepID=A0ABS5PSF2_9FIRM|nr:polysaccharide biosynthesis C-terminal domain-containing protein [Fusibacter paucivorans]MBS7528098.1 polysaccharide biosynthesis C-terminal domain-containing protein [Fusibacter paucivorans]